MNKPKPSLTLITLLILGLSPCADNLNAHFVWIGKDAKTGEARVYFGEGPEPDRKMFLTRIAKIKTWRLEKGKFVSAEAKQTVDGDDGWFVVNADQACTEIVGDVTYGLFSRDESQMLLHYCAKFGELTIGQSLSAKSTALLPVNIVAACKKKNIRIKVLTGKKTPAADCEVVVVDAAGKTHEQKTNSNGVVTIPTAAGRFLIRAKVVDPKAGTYEGKEYSEKRTYCTLVLDVSATKSTSTPAEAAVKANRTTTLKDEPKKIELADMPVGLTSFGGAIANNHLYIFGGHKGKAHQYYESGQNTTLYELDLKKPASWKRVGEGLGLQGLAMVAHEGKVYRLGGFHAHNQEGEDQDLRSVKDFAVFDFESKQWKQLDPMPEGRSSFDAVVINDTIYVVGGWQMKGDEGTTWSKTAIKYDLGSENAKWEPLPAPPFRRRALSVGHQGGKLVVVGGMQDKGGPTKKVALFDLKTKKWSDGPVLPGEGSMEGFGSSCFNVGGQLVASTYGGGVYRLADDFSKWMVVGKLDEGRFFHRLLPINEQQFVLVGGASMDSGKFYELEVLSK